MLVPSNCSFRDEVELVKGGVFLEHHVDDGEVVK